MRRIGDGLGMLVVSLLGLVGCASTEPHLKPPKQPEAYVLPPTDDPRYSEPIRYPDGTLNKDTLRKGDLAAPGGPEGPGGSGGPGSRGAGPARFGSNPGGY